MISRDCREVYVFLAMIICGGALAVVFDMLRAMRMVLNPSAVIVSASDILFWNLRHLS